MYILTILNGKPPSESVQLSESLHSYLVPLGKGIQVSRALSGRLKLKQ